MKVRVISYSNYSKWHEENFNERGEVPIEALSDADFMDIYKRGGIKWEFNSLESFQNEFSLDGPLAPTPSEHIIRFFPNE